MKLKIGMVYDLRTDYLAEGYSEENAVEFDSEATIAALEQALRHLEHQPERIGHGRTLCHRLVDGDRWDLVFNIAEGVRGRSREAQVPALLEMFNIPYTFSDPLVCAVTLDKAVTKKLVRDAGLNTPDFCVIRELDDTHGIRMGYPLFAKPIAEGTGKGIDQSSHLENRDQLIRLCKLLKRFDTPILVEEFLPGREFTVGILGTGKDARVLGTMEVEILPEAGGTIYSLAVKEHCEELVKYPELADVTLRTEVEELALKSYLALECRDAGRVDIRLDSENKPSFMELNVLPGLHPSHSDLPIIATQQGMSYTELIGAIVDSALNRTFKAL